MIALMTPPEREQMEVVLRVFRIRDTKTWLSAQARRFESAIRCVPVFGAMVGRRRDGADESPPSSDRHAVASSYFESVATRQAYELRRAARSGAFWDEVRKWAGLSPADRTFAWTESERGRLRRDANAFQEAMEHWNARVEVECKGISPNIKGAVGAAVLGIAIVLVAVPGPVSVLTVAAAKGAIGAALGKLAALTGAGALFGTSTRLRDASSAKRFSFFKVFTADLIP